MPEIVCEKLEPPHVGCYELLREARHQAHQGFLGELVARQFSHFFAFAHDEDAAAQIHDFGEFAADDNHAGAFAGELVDQRVHLGFGPDINAAGWFVDDQYVAAASEPFGEGDFLLVTTAQARDGRVEGRGFDAKLIDELRDDGSFFFEANEAGAGEFGQSSERGIFGAGHGEDQALAFAVFGTKTDSCCEGSFN